MVLRKTFLPVLTRIRLAPSLPKAVPFLKKCTQPGPSTCSPYPASPESVSAVKIRHLPARRQVAPLRSRRAKSVDVTPLICIKIFLLTSTALRPKMISYFSAFVRIFPLKQKHYHLFGIYKILLRILIKTNVL